MQVLYFDGKKLSFHHDHPTPAPRKGEALVQVVLAGICSTDLEIIKGYMGFIGIPGHEFTGVVVEAPDTSWVGKRVVGSINASCGQCHLCCSVGYEHCPERTVLGIAGREGAFAEYLSLPLSNLFEIPPNISEEEAVFTEPIAAAVRICEQIKIPPSANIAVVGPGRLGLLIGQVLIKNGAELTMLGRSSTSNALLKTLGLPYGRVENKASDSYDVVVEATGNVSGLSHSLRLVKPGGTMVLKSTFAGKTEIDLTKIVVSEITVIGSRCGPFAPALRLLSDGSIKIKPLIEAEYPLKDGIAAFKHAAKPGVKKILLRPAS